MKGGEILNMAFIYDLDNEYGGVILSDAGSPSFALRVNSREAAFGAIGIQSTASTNPIVVDSFGTTGGALFRGVAAGARALQIGRTVVGSNTIAPLLFAHTSTASGAIMEFGGGFISVTSILGTAATGAGLGFDYVIPVSVNGVMRGIPLTSLVSLPGAAAW